MVSFVPRVNSLRNNRVCKFAMNRTFYFFFPVEEFLYSPSLLKSHALFCSFYECWNPDQQDQNLLCIKINMHLHAIWNYLTATNGTLISTFMVNCNQLLRRINQILKCNW